MSEDSILQAERHSDGLLHLFQHLYRHQLCTDVTLVAEGRHFSAHMVVLAAYSPYFRNIFETQHGQAGYGVQYLNNISALCLEALLEFLYTGSLHLNPSSVWYIMVAATELQLKAVTDLCHNYQTGSFGSGVQDEGLEKATGPAFSTLPGTIKSEEPELGHLDLNSYDFLASGRKSSTRGRKKKKSKTRSRKKAKTPEKQLDYFNEEAASDDIDCDNDADSDLVSDSNWMPYVHVTLNPTKVKVRRTSRRTKVTSNCNVEMQKRPILKLPRTQEYKYQCDACQCHKSYRYYSTLQLHKKVHRQFLSSRYVHRTRMFYTRETGLGKLQYTCSKCDKIFHLHSTWVQHQRLCHNVGFACLRCHSTFPSRLRLAKHGLKSHKKKIVLRTGNLHNCEGCGRVFVHNTNLTRHTSQAHSGTPKKRGVGRPRKYAITVAPRKRKTAGRKSKTDGFWYTCPLCLERFHSKFAKKFQLHLVEAHDLSTEEMQEACESSKHNNKNSPDRNCCSECATHCKTRKALLEHVKSVHSDVSFPCRCCNYTARLRPQLEKHMLQRHGKDSWRRSCEMCDRTFNTKYHLIRHKFAIHGIGHPTLQEYKCKHGQCEYVTYSEHMLKQHQRRHNTEKPFTCEICKKSMKTAHALEAHIKKVHLDIRPWICDQCGAAYGEEHELKLHMGRHDQTKEFRCEFCNYCTHLRGELRRHLFVVHNIKLDHKMQVYECTQCNYRTTHRNRFQDHERWHRDVRDIKCPHCDKKFTTMTSQRGHIKAVHKPKHLKCTYCSYASSLVSQMKTHVRVMHTHPNHKPFKCAYCDFHCATSGNCRKHIMQRHKGLEVKWVKVAEKTPALAANPQWMGNEVQLPVLGN